MVIGLTGPSGAGKTTFCELFPEYDIINCDELYHELLETNGDMRDELVDAFGSSDREVLRKIVFSSENLLKLNSITWKYIIPEIEKRLTANCIIDAPQLFESGAHEFCRFTVALVLSKEECLAQIALRDSITREEAIVRIEAQKGIEYYSDKADIIEDFTGKTKEESLEICKKIKRKLLFMAEHSTHQP